MSKIYHYDNPSCCRRYLLDRVLRRIGAQALRSLAIISYADGAMYGIKKTGKDAYTFYVAGF
jgi:hypothetical protein